MILYIKYFFFFSFFFFSYSFFSSANSGTTDGTLFHWSSARRTGHRSMLPAILWGCSSPPFLLLTHLCMTHIDFDVIVVS